MVGFVEGIFLAPEAGAEMKSVQVATALEGCGLEGDRYCAGTGHWSHFGEVAFEYRGPRSVCRYIERLTEPGMTQALKGRGGICARVIENGTIRVGDEIEVLQPTEERA